MAILKDSKLFGRPGRFVAGKWPEGNDWRGAGGPDARVVKHYTPDPHWEAAAAEAMARRRQIGQTHKSSLGTCGH